MTKSVTVLALLAFASGANGQGEEFAQPPQRYTARYAGSQVKRALVGKDAARAIGFASDWLSAQQADDGSWESDAGVSALALLAIMGDGSTRTFGEHKGAVSRGLDWLCAREGLSGEAAALAALALADHRSVELDDVVEPKLQALIGSVSAEEPGDPVPGAWRVLALLQAREADIEVPSSLLEAARAALAGRVPKTGSVERIEERGAKERATAAVLCVRLRLGEEPEKGSLLLRQLNRVAKKRGRPLWADRDFEYAFFGATALQPSGSAEWAGWRKALHAMLLEDGAPEAGAWEPASGSKVKATALASLALQVDVRFAEASRGASGVVGIGGGAGGRYGARFGRRNLGRYGGAGVELPLADALDWLALQQADSGAWTPSDSKYHVGLTGLALLALMGNGSTTRMGPHKATVQKGVKWLVDGQQESGALVKPHDHMFLYEHAIATQALCEAYYFSKSPLLHGPAQKAIDYVVRAQNPYSGWRYSVPPDNTNDTSVTAWMLLALAAGEQAGLEFDARVIESAMSYLDTMTDPATGRVGYDARGSLSARVSGVNDMYPPEQGETMTAMAMFARILHGEEDHDIVERQGDLLLKTLPEWDEQLGTEVIYTCFGTHAMFQMGGRYWKSWNKAMKVAVLEAQVRRGADKGSWEPIGPWGMFGGRVYTTAMMTLALESYFRYARLVR